MGGGEGPGLPWACFGVCFPWPLGLVFLPLSSLCRQVWSFLSALACCCCPAFFLCVRVLCWRKFQFPFLGSLAALPLFARSPAVSSIYFSFSLGFWFRQISVVIIYFMSVASFSEDFIGQQDSVASSLKHVQGIRYSRSKF